MSSPRKRVVIIGSGIAGLAAASTLGQLDASIEVKVLEATPRAGGVLQTIDDPPYLVERSADNFATMLPDALNFCKAIGYDTELIGPEAIGRQAFVLNRGRILPIPLGFSLVQPTRIWPILTTKTLSFAGKLRMLSEYFVPARQKEDDESLQSFATRRLGHEAFENLVEPIVGGIFTADPGRLSMQATLPQFVAMEKKFGGLMRGYRAARRDNAAATSRRASGARYDQFLAPRHGMSHWINHIVQALPPQTIVYESVVTAIEPRIASKSWTVTTTGSVIDCDGLILASPVPIAAGLLQSHFPILADLLSKIEYASSAVVAVAVDRDEIHRRVDGFGMIVPAKEKRPTLAISYSSNKYPGRAPADQLLMRIFIGGARDPNILEKSDDQLTSIALAEIRELLDWRGTQCRWQTLIRWPRAMPQYHLGHVQRIAQIQSLVDAIGTLRLCGAGYIGVGLPQTIRSGRTAAEKIIGELADSATLSR